MYRKMPASGWDIKKRPEACGLGAVLGGVADGTRTHDDQNHNLGLYQLSYSHRKNGRL